MFTREIRSYWFPALIHIVTSFSAETFTVWVVLRSAKVPDSQFLPINPLHHLEMHTYVELLVAKMSEHLVIREELLTAATRIMDEFNLHPLLRDLEIFPLVQSFCMQALHSLDIVQSQMKETMDTLVRFHGKTHQVFKEKYQQQGEDLVRANQATETVIRSWEQADPNKRSTIDKFMTTQAEEPISFYTRKLHQEQHLLAEVKKPRVAIVYKYASAKAVYYEEDEGEEGVEKTTPSTPADIFNDLEKALYHTLA